MSAVLSTVRLSRHFARSGPLPRRGICVAAVQSSARASRLHDNIALAAPLVAAAARAGADLVLLPEAFPQGYSYEPELVWPFVDSIHLDSFPSAKRAPACAAIAALATEHGVWIGCTVLERGSGRSSSDVFNTFVLLQPDGHLHPARHTKRVPAAFENLVFAPPDEERARLPRVLDTPLGRLGVSICYETYLEETWAELAEQAPDAILMPHCGGVGRPSPVLPEKVVEAARASMLSAPADFARVFGVPTVFTNQVRGAALVVWCTRNKRISRELKQCIRFLTCHWIHSQIGSISSRLPGVFSPASFLTADIPFEGDARVHSGGSGAEAARVGQNGAPGWTFARLDLAQPPTRPSAAEAVARLQHLDFPALLTNAFAIDNLKWLGGKWYAYHASRRAALFREMDAR